MRQGHLLQAFRVFFVAGTKVDQLQTKILRALGLILHEADHAPRVSAPHGNHRQERSRQ